MRQCNKKPKQSILVHDSVFARDIFDDVVKGDMPYNFDVINVKCSALAIKTTQPTAYAIYRSYLKAAYILW